MIRFQRLIQLISFAAFLFLIIWAAYPETLDLPLDTFLKLDPLIAGVTLITSRHFQAGFLLSLLVLLSALVVGRGFLRVCVSHGDNDRWDSERNLPQVKTKVSAIWI